MNKDYEMRLSMFQPESAGGVIYNVFSVTELEKLFQGTTDEIEAWFNLREKGFDI